jgi:uncharacterized protein (TIGR04141 family)
VPALTFYRLRELTDIDPTDLDQYVDTDEHELAVYGPIDGPDFRAKLYVSSGEPRPPLWADFLCSAFDTAVIPSATFVAAVLVVRLNDPPNAAFAIGFGTIARYLLRNDVYSRAYGLRAALNLAGSSTRPGKRPAGPMVAVETKRHSADTVRTRSQAARATTFEAFDLDQLRDVVGGVTVTARDPETWGTRVTGADALHFSTQHGFNDLGRLCRDVETAHDQEQYRIQFGWLDHFQPVTDPRTLDLLENKVITAINAGQLDDLDLAPPEGVDWTRIDTFRFHFDGIRKQRRPELRLPDLINGVRQYDGREGVDSHLLRSRKISALNADGRPEGQWSIWRCLSGELSAEGSSFVLDDGEFWRISGDYLADLNQSIAQIPETAARLPAAVAGDREDAYNRFAVRSLGPHALLLDRVLVRSSRRTTAVELCDILTEDRCLIHVKRHLGSRDLSHLFSQGRVSAELIQNDRDFRAAAHRKIGETTSDARFNFLDVPDIETASFEVGFAIVHSWRGRPLSEELPFFSKINLRRTAEELQSRGFRVSCTAVGVGR